MSEVPRFWATVYRSAIIKGKRLILSWLGSTVAERTAATVKTRMLFHLLPAPPAGIPPDTLREEPQTARGKGKRGGARRPCGACQSPPHSGTNGRPAGLRERLRPSAFEKEQRVTVQSPDGDWRELRGEKACGRTTARVRSIGGLHSRTPGVGSSRVLFPEKALISNEKVVPYDPPSDFAPKCRSTVTHTLQRASKGNRI